ncbi:general substrate transporter, partial [Aureobasidium melanogenum]
MLSDRALADSSLDSFAEAALDLCLPMCFRIAKEDVEGHGEAENAEDDLAVFEQHDAAPTYKSKVEDPVGGSRETNSLSTVLEREDLGTVDPATGSPGKSIEANKDVTDSDDALGCSIVVDLPPEDSVAVDRIHMVSVASHKASNGEVAETANDRSGQEKQTARDSVNIRQDDTTSAHRKRSGSGANLLLNDGRGKGLIAETSHFEDVNNVVHGDVASE